jgi:hypothetical protein
MRLGVTGDLALFALLLMIPVFTWNTSFPRLDGLGLCVLLTPETFEAETKAQTQQVGEGWGGLGDEFAYGLACRLDGIGAGGPGCWGPSGVLGVENTKHHPVEENLTRWCVCRDSMPMIQGD